MCISILFDESFKTVSPVDTALPSIESLKNKVQSFKVSLSVTEEHKIECDIRIVPYGTRYVVTG